MENFDPNATGLSDSGIFALPFSKDEAKLVLIPVPWDVTTSYGKGAQFGPDAIRTSSHQMDLCDPLLGPFYQAGIYMEPTNARWAQRNSRLGKESESIQRRLEKGDALSPSEQNAQATINAASLELNSWIENQCLALIADKKIPAIVGGDHSSPFGAISAFSKTYKNLSILHIDAHCDLRKGYQGFEHSHASIMYNVMENLPIQHLVQVGIRDYCPEELEYATNHPHISTFFDGPIHKDLHSGKPWSSLCFDIFESLSSHVYISFDIDGLTPDLCPHTGTPVPGGLDFPQITTLLSLLKDTGRQIVGFDLCEVAPEEGTLDGWDGNVGARILYKLCGTVLSGSSAHPLN